MMICIAAAILFVAGIFIAAMFTSAGGDLELQVVFPANPAAPSEPLVVAGKFGAADFLIVQYPDPETIRLRYDTWGTNGTPLPDLRIPRNELHWMRVRMPALHTPRNVLRPGTEPVDELVIQLDGRELTRMKVRGNSVQPDQIYIGSNPVGGTTCSLSFSGQIVGGFKGSSGGDINALLAEHSVLVALYCAVCSGGVCYRGQ
jgi:hypothetical protein